MGHVPVRERWASAQARTCSIVNGDCLAAIALLGGFSGGEGWSLDPARHQQRRRARNQSARFRQALPLDYCRYRVYQPGAPKREATVWSPRPLRLGLIGARVAAPTRPSNRLVISPARASRGSSPPARIIVQACRLGNGAARRGVKAGFSARFAMIRWSAPNPC